MNKIFCFQLATYYKLLFFLTKFILLPTLCIAQDVIIYRDGRVRQVKIIQTNNDKTLFKEWGNKHATEEFVENVKVFMLKFNARGNVVFDSKGERVFTTSEPVQIPKDAIVVYYRDGREVPVYNLTMDANVISFKTSKPAKKGGLLFGKKVSKLVNDTDRPMYSPRSDVFMISYPDGTRDILTNLTVEEDKYHQRESENIRLNMQRKLVQTDSTATASEYEKTLSVSNPKKAIIVTKAGCKLKVWICSETSTSVSYKKENTSKAAIFKMSKLKVKNIIF